MCCIIIIIIIIIIIKKPICLLSLNTQRSQLEDHHGRLVFEVIIGWVGLEISQPEKRLD